MYCKCRQILLCNLAFLVLIVAKCIVNQLIALDNLGEIQGINSSKVYCKSFRGII